MASEDTSSGRFTAKERAEAWSTASEIVKTYSDDMVKRLNAEIDTLLVYAGLFSAILTAFNVESYTLLQPAQPDPTLLALERISMQLGGFLVHPPHVNSTQPPFRQSEASLATDPPTSPPPWAVWLNVLWFSSLICSLAAASVGITVKQWLHEYNSGLSGTSRHTARLRQRRLNSLAKWRVAEITALLPVVLQLALLLYSAGLLLLLWNLHQTVAIVATVLLGTLLLFIVLSTALPLFSADCCYLSPQSLALYAFWKNASYRFNQAAYVVARRVVLTALWVRDALPSRLRIRTSVLQARWTKPLHRWIICFQRVPRLMSKTPVSWRGQERLTVSKQRRRLDADLLAQAFDVSLDEEHLDRTIAVGIAELPTPDALHCCSKLSKSLSRHGKDHTSAGTSVVNPLVMRERFWTSLVESLLIGCCLSNPRSCDDKGNWRTPEGEIVFRRTDIDHGFYNSLSVRILYRGYPWAADVRWLVRAYSVLVVHGCPQEPEAAFWASQALCVLYRDTERAGNHGILNGTASKIGCSGGCCGF
ncbi:hypothetical protein OH77DRAFT_973970 [Trametes cingulata]|nr:hypothetical protein OH77DRAFT_973970 [Trametes cingulata]